MVEQERRVLGAQPARFPDGGRKFYGRLLSSEQYLKVVVGVGGDEIDGCVGRAIELLGSDVPVEGVDALVGRRSKGAEGAIVAVHQRNDEGCVGIDVDVVPEFCCEINHALANTRWVGRAEELKHRGELLGRSQWSAGFDGFVDAERQLVRYGRSFGNRCGGRSRRCACLLYTSPSPRDATLSRMPSSA